jgi:hypothetical protein
MGIEWRRARRRGRLAADRFELAGAVTFEQLAARISAVTGRTTVIDVTNELDPLGASGRLDRYGSLNAETADLDVIRVPAEVDEAHQLLIVLHEIGHLLLDHTLVPADGVDLGALPLMAEIFGQDKIGGAYKMTGHALRSCHEGEDRFEIEAESFALRMAVRIRRAKVPHVRLGVDEAAERLAERVDRTFGGE